MNTLRKYKHSILLAALLCVALIESFSHRRVLGPIISDLAITMMLLLVFLIVFHRRVNRLVAFIALAIAVASGLAGYVLPPGYPEAPLRLVYHSAALVLVGFATLVILRNIFQQRVVRSDDVLGAVCGYLLAAGAWANLFMLIEIFSPRIFQCRPGVRRNARHLARTHRRTDLHQSAWWNRIPFAAWGLMRATAICSVALVGFGAGSRKAESKMLFVLALVVPSAFVL